MAKASKTPLTIELYTHFDAEEMIAWLKHLMDESKRTGDSHVSLIRDILSSLYKEILSHCKLTCPIETRSLITLLDVDLYLTAADADHVDTEESVNACDISAELEKRGEAGDQEAKQAYESYCEEVMNGLVM